MCDHVHCSRSLASDHLTLDGRTRGENVRGRDTELYTLDTVLLTSYKLQSTLLATLVQGGEECPSIASVSTIQSVLHSVDCARVPPSPRPTSGRCWTKVWPRSAAGRDDVETWDIVSHDSYCLLISGIDSQCRS